MTLLYPFLSGAVTMGFAVAALFFLRFWTQTRDGLFMAFALAFLLLGLNQAVLGLDFIPSDERSLAYLLRLSAFLIIIAAVVQKNRR